MNLLLTRLCLLLALLLPIADLHAQAVDPLPFKDRAEEVRFQQLAHELRCVQCQNNSLADSDGMIAKDVRHEVFRLMREGLSNDQIKAHLVVRYGEFVLYKPTMEPRNWLLWFGPGLAALLTLIWLLRWMRQRARSESAVILPKDEF